MRNHKKQYAVLFTIFLSITTINLGFVLSNLKSITPPAQTDYYNNLKTSALFNTTITIDDTNPAQNWVTRKAEGVCTGLGTSANPYIINNHLFNITAGGNCLSIVNSRKHFRVLGCDFITTGLAAAIYLENTTNGRVEGNHITNIFGGIIIDNCSQIQFIDNNITLCGIGFLVGDSDNLDFNLNLVDQSLLGFGIDIDNCIGMSFTQNTVSESATSGIYLDDSNDITFTNNILFNNTYGIYNDNSNGTIIQGSTIGPHTQDGIYIFQSYRGTISNNDITNCVDNGIELEESEIFEISSNTANNNYRGIYLFTSSLYNTLSENTANNNALSGIELRTESNNNTLRGNTANHNGEEGIWLFDCHISVILDNTVFNNTRNGIRMNQGNILICNDNEAYNNLLNGIRLFQVDDSLVEGNNVHHNGEAGIRLVTSTERNIIRGNIASMNNMSGVYVSTGCNENLISDNTASNNEEHGIFIEGATNTLIISNDAHNNLMNGIYLRLSDGNSIISNTASGNVNGTNLQSSDDNMIFGNLLFGNDYCMNETNSINNVYSDNLCTAPVTPGVPLDPFILGLIIGLFVGFGALAAVLILNALRGRKK